MIQINELSKKYGKLEVLKNVSLTCAKGECIALIGPNGCGKTTLIKSILGLVIPDRGEIMVKGKSIFNNYLYRRDLGYMPQIGRYPENRTIGQILDMVKNIRKDVIKYDEELLEAFDLKKLLDKKMSTLSGGTTQKVSATLAFLFNPDLLILDEPTAGLDPLAADILKEKIILEKSKGKLILITSHLLNELDELISEILFMNEGEVKFHESIAKIREMTGEEKISKAISKILKQNQHA